MSLVQDSRMIRIAGAGDRDRHSSQVEQHLMRFRALAVMPETLNQRRGAAHEERFRQAQLDNSEENENEQYRQRPGDRRENDLETRCQNGEDQIAEEARQILRFPTA